MKSNGMVRRAMVMLGVLPAIIASAAAWPQSYPNRPIRLVVPFAPGGPTDLSARIIAAKLGDVLGQSVVVDNRAGAGGSVGTEIVINAKGDGYTLLLCSSSVMVLNPLLSAATRFSPLRDLAPLSIVTASPFVLLTNTSSRAKTTQELIEMARSQPNTMTFGSGGVGTGGHLAGELFRSMAAIQISHVPYKGSGPAAIALIGGHVNMAFESISSSLGNINGGRLIALGVSSRKRAAVLPSVQTIIEAGLSEFEVTSWQGLCAPRDTPQSLVATLNKAITAAVKAPATEKQFATLGVEATTNTPTEFVEFVKFETSRWSKVIQEIGLKSQ